MHTPPDAEPLAIAYLLIIFLAIPPMFLFTFMMMALRGAGDARTPFYFMLISAGLDVALNPLLIIGVGPFPALGIAGSAVATTIAQWLALILLILWLYARRHTLRIASGEWGYFRIDRVILSSLLTKGIPMGLQVIVVSSSMIAMISLVNRYGSATVAAYGACFQLWNYISMPAFAVGSAVSSMAAQNVGAGRWDRVNRIAIVGVVYNILLTGAFVVAVTLSDNVAFALFLGHNTAAIAMARHMHLIVSWSYILFGISFVLSSVVRATGAVIPPLLILFFAVWGVRLPAALLLSGLGVNGILWGFPAGSIASAVTTAVYYRYGSWREAKMLVAV
jgi:putative MATE family efflux protein